MIGAQVCLHLHDIPDAALLAQLLEALAEANAAWFISEWAQGRRPPNTAREARVLYRPDEPSRSVTFATAPLVFRQGVASCGPIAAISVGQARAAEVVGGHTWASARQRHRVELVPQRRLYWHAVHRTPTGIVDPTRGMRG